MVILSKISESCLITLNKKYFVNILENKYNLYSNFTIALGLCFFNKKDEIKRLLSTLGNNNQDGVDCVLAIDGAFPFICDLHKKDENFSPLSTDGSREVLQEFADQQRKDNGSRAIKVIIDNCVANEFTKRNRYLEICSWFEFKGLIILDSDEYFDFVGIEQWIKFKENWKQAVIKTEGDHNVFGLNTVVDLYGRTVPYPRLWYNPFEMRYHKYSHYKFLNYAKGQQHSYPLDSQYSAETINGLTMKHDHNLRNDNDMEDRKLYEDYIVRYEELVAHNIDPKSADIIARMKPGKHKDNCICFKCINFKKIDVSKIIDPRKKKDRIDDPFEQFRNNNKS